MARTNRLVDQTSPYLLQHATNPVDWWPWCDEAFEEARRRDVPVLVSVGYSACHWCHVMAHESFEDAEVAQVVNANFVAVKVDREERPDVDAVYMEAVQLVTGSGGWPMTVLTLHDGRPFWAGTYLPRQHLLGLVSRVSEVWVQRRTDVERDAQALTDALQRGTALPGHELTGHELTGHQLAFPPTPAGANAQGTPGEGALGAAASALLANHDPEWGGRAGAPKFPQPATLEVLARHWHRTGDEAAGRAWRLTLDAMSSGGMYDHLGGGFARYSTDRRWLVPHFEKMLYDNALLLRSYTQAWQLTGAPRYRQVVEETVGYLLAPPMRLPDRAWASAEDADSEGTEGRFYTWDYTEVVEVGGAEVAAWYGVTPEGNWEGRNILWRPGRGDLARPPELDRARAALSERRSQRVRPGLDDKVLTEWNAMAVASVSAAGAAFDRADWISEAVATAEALCRLTRRPDGRWLRSWRAGQQGPPAFCGDYAWLTDAFTRLYEATGDARWAHEAVRTAKEMERLFWDPDGGGFFTYGQDAPPLVARLKDAYDGAAPAANSVAAASLGRLGHLTGDRHMTDMALRLVERLWPAMQRTPSGFPAMALAADELTVGGPEVVVAGHDTAMVRPVFERYLPGAVLAWGEPFASPLWEARTGPDSTGKAYVCHGYRCELPVTSPGELARLLDAR